MKLLAKLILSILMLLVIVEVLSAQSTPKYENGNWVDIDPKADERLGYREFFDDEMVEKVKSALLCMQRHSWEQGTAMQGMLEIGDTTRLIIMARESVQRKKPDGRLSMVWPLPHTTPSRLVNSLKGVSSRFLRQEFPELEKYFWKGGLWSPSYFIASCGGAPLDIVKKYIENQ